MKNDFIFKELGKDSNVEYLARNCGLEANTFMCENIQDLNAATGVFIGGFFLTVVFIIGLVIGAAWKSIW